MRRSTTKSDAREKVGDGAPSPLRTRKPHLRQPAARHPGAADHQAPPRLSQPAGRRPGSPASHPPPASASVSRAPRSLHTRLPSSPTVPLEGLRPCVGPRTPPSLTLTTTPRRRLPSLRSSAGAPRRTSPPQRAPLSWLSCRWSPRGSRPTTPQWGESGAGGGHVAAPMRPLTTTAVCRRAEPRRAPLPISAWGSASPRAPVTRGVFQPTNGGGITPPGPRARSRASPPTND